MRAPVGKTATALVLALCFVAGAAGWALGRGTNPGGGDARVVFLRQMIAHHQQAIEMSQVELLDGARREVKVYAEEILRFQAYEIGLMERFLADWGHERDDEGHLHMPGMASPEEMDGLRAAEGDDVDAWFIALMVDHHAAGTQMAETIAGDRGDASVEGLAARMAIAQQSEIAELLRVAERFDLDVPPEGVTWDVHSS
ncbi:MAG TPA: DUF305 domain-containing protein [Acidimicrobiales bacterium]|nr:DUF305 domain-containing protein [Acidimicrobiales bacterium]